MTLSFAPLGAVPHPCRPQAVRPRPGRPALQRQPRVPQSGPVQDDHDVTAGPGRGRTDREGHVRGGRQGWQRKDQLQGVQVNVSMCTVDKVFK